MGSMVIDIDHFKNFNGTYGHDAGDAVLKELGSLLAENFRGEDIACRYGGEEFVMILPESPLESTVRRAGELRQMVKALTVKINGDQLGGLTVSIGVSGFPQRGITGAELLKIADRALYRAKANGRNQVEGHGPAA